MATGFEFFERDLKVATAGLEPDEINRAVARFAREELRRVIATGQAGHQFQRYVNGVQGAVEESYRAPGAIIYEFTNWPIIIAATIDELVKRAPRKSGRYAGSFIVIADGKVVSNYGSIDAANTISIVNYQPYTRKLDSSRTAARRHFLWAYHAIRQRFGQAFQVRNTYLTLPAGIHPSIPYILKGSGRLVAAAQNNRSSAFRAGRATLARRKDTEAGQPITYPAIIIKAAN